MQKSQVTYSLIGSLIYGLLFQMHSSFPSCVVALIIAGRLNISSEIKILLQLQKISVQTIKFSIKPYKLNMKKISSETNGKSVHNCCSVFSLSLANHAILKLIMSNKMYICAHFSIAAGNSTLKFFFLIFFLRATLVLHFTLL